MILRRDSHLTYAVVPGTEQRGMSYVFFGRLDDKAFSHSLGRAAGSEFALIVAAALCVLRTSVGYVVAPISCLTAVSYEVLYRGMRQWTSPYGGY
jgi:hypothetical protein